MTKWQNQNGILDVNNKKPRKRRNKHCRSATATNVTIFKLENNAWRHRSCSTQSGLCYYDTLLSRVIGSYWTDIDYANDVSRSLPRHTGSTARIYSLFWLTRKISGQFVADLSGHEIVVWGRGVPGDLSEKRDPGIQNWKIPVLNQFFLFTSIFIKGNYTAHEMYFNIPWCWLPWAISPNSFGWSTTGNKLKKFEILSSAWFVE